MSLQSFQMGGLAVVPYHDSVFPEEFTSGYIGTALNFVSDCHMLFLRSGIRFIVTLRAVHVNVIFTLIKVMM